MLFYTHWLKKKKKNSNRYINYNSTNQQIIWSDFRIIQTWVGSKKKHFSLVRGKTKKKKIPTKETQDMKALFIQNVHTPFRSRFSEWGIIIHSSLNSSFYLYIILVLGTSILSSAQALYLVHVRTSRENFESNKNLTAVH